MTSDCMAGTSAANHLIFTDLRTNMEQFVWKDKQLLNGFSNYQMTCVYFVSVSGISMGWIFLGKSCSTKSRFLYFSICTCCLLLLKWVRARLTSRLEPGWLFLFSVFFFQSLKFFMTANDRTKKNPTHNTSYFNPWQPFKESLILNSECNVCNAASPVRCHGWMTVYFLY